MTRRTRIALVSTSLALAGCSSSAPRTAATTTSRPRTTFASAAPTIQTVPTTSTTVGVLPAAVTNAPPATGAASPPAGTSAPAAPPTTAKGRTVTSPSDNVHLGDRGPGVTQVQSALAAAGYAVAADGSFGAQTEQAVKNFQSKHGLTADGIVGPATWSKLKGTGTPATTVKATATTAKGTATTTTGKATTTTTIRR